MKKLFIYFILLITSAAGFAQGLGEITGMVYNADTKETIPGANISVIVNGSIVCCTTNVDGFFRLKSIPSGIYDVKVSYTGYNYVLISGVEVLSDGITPVNDVALIPGIGITGAEIIYIRPKIDPEGKMYIPYSDLDVMPDKGNLEKIVSIICPGVQSSEDGSLYFRGARNNDFVYIVDGFKIHGTNPSIPSGAISNMSVYTGGVPARYGDFTGGCIVIETWSYFDWVNAKNAKKSNN